MNPLEMASNVLGGRWRIRIIYALLKGPVRFTNLEKTLGISKRILNAELHRLRDLKLVTRTSYPEIPPRVEYALTQEGMELRTIIYDLHQMGQKFMERQLPMDEQPDQPSLL